jgi:hypothetical protein
VTRALCWQVHGLVIAQKNPAPPVRKGEAQRRLNGAMLTIGRRPSPTSPGTFDAAPAFEAGATLFLVGLILNVDLPGVAARIGAANLSVRPVELGKLTVICPLRRVQAQQSGRNALGVGGSDRRGGHQCNEGYRSGEYEGLLEKLRHDAFSFGLDAPRNP